MNMHRFLLIVSAFVLITFFYPQTIGLARSNKCYAPLVGRRESLEDSLKNVIRINLKAINISIQSVRQQQTIIQLQTKYNESNLPFSLPSKDPH